MALLDLSEDRGVALMLEWSVLELHPALHTTLQGYDIREAR